jgi:hypothetical protein
MTKRGPGNGCGRHVIDVPEEDVMRTSLLMLGLAAGLVASPAFAQKAPSSFGAGNYDFSGSLGGEASGGMTGGSGYGSGNAGTSHGKGSLNAGSGIAVDGSGLTRGTSSLPSSGGNPSIPGVGGR